MPSEFDCRYIVVETNFVLFTPGDSLHTFEAIKINQKVTKSDTLSTLRRPRGSWGQQAVFQLFDKQSILPACETNGRC